MGYLIYLLENVDSMFSLLHVYLYNLYNCHKLYCLMTITFWKWIYIYMYIYRSKQNNSVPTKTTGGHDFNIIYIIKKYIYIYTPTFTLNNFWIHIDPFLYMIYKTVSELIYTSLIICMGVFRGQLHVVHGRGVILYCIIWHIDWTFFHWFLTGNNKCIINFILRINQFHGACQVII